MSISPDAEGYKPFTAEGPPEVEVHVVQAWMPISDVLAMDCGLIPDTRPPSPPLSRRLRFRFWRARTRTALAVRLCRWLAGCDLHDDELF